MGIKHIAAAMIAPAAIAGVALSTGGAANAAAVSHARPKAAVHHARPNKYHQWVTVRAGDTLSGLAAAHHISWQALYATPPNMKTVHNPNVITVGERLRIPADPKLRAAQFAALELRHAREATPTQDRVQQPAVQQQAAQQPAAQAQAGSAGTASPSAGMSSFEQCVTWRESSDTPTDPDGLFGILPSVWASLGYSGTAGQASVAQQQIAFSRLYAEYGAQPWAPSDGC